MGGALCQQVGLTGRGAHAVPLAVNFRDVRTSNSPATVASPRRVSHGHGFHLSLWGVQSPHPGIPMCTGAVQMAHERATVTGHEYPQGPADQQTYRPVRVAQFGNKQAAQCACQATLQHSCHPIPNAYLWHCTRLCEQRWPGSSLLSRSPNNTQPCCDSPCQAPVEPPQCVGELSLHITVGSWARCLV